MKKKLLLIGITLVFGLTAFKVGKDLLTQPNYVGTQACALCHQSKFDSLQTTLHAKIHLVPSATSVRPPWTGSISMGSGYSNASVVLGMNGAIYQATLTPTTGSPITYDIAYTYGYGFKQRYLVSIESSKYILPIQYNLNKYMDNSTGSWATYNPGNWFNTDGTLKTINNTFRKKSWDKNCSACHITGNKIVKTINGTDTAWVSSWANSSSNLNMTVGCESCHGPGENHVASPNTSNIYGPTAMSGSIARSNEVCGQCHSRAASPQLTYKYPYNEIADSSYYPGQVLSNFYTPWITLLNLTGGPGVWPDTTSSQHHQQWQDMSYSSHFTNTTCFDKCHDPHSNGVGGVGTHQLKQDNDNNDICLQCHTIFGNVGAPNITAITTHTKHSYDPENLNSTGGASRCSKCHMAKTATSAKSYDIHSHSWKVISPCKTLTLGMINSCSASCHRNATGNIPTFGVPTDSTLTNWTQAADIQLADTLCNWYSQQVWTNVNTIAALASQFSLSQNYPNPFQTKTVIYFTLAKAEHVTLKVYDITGKLVQILVNKKMEQGVYNVNFDITNIESATSNILFYQLKAGEFVVSKKMICLK